MPKLTEEALSARAAKHEEKRDKVLNSVKVERVRTIMKEYPVLVPSIARHAQDEVAKLNAQHGGSVKPVAAVATSPPPFVAPSGSATAALELEGARSRNIDRQSNRLIALPVVDLKTILFSIDGRLFTPW